MTPTQLDLTQPASWVLVIAAIVCASGTGYFVGGSGHHWLHNLWYTLFLCALLVAAVLTGSVLWQSLSLSQSTPTL